MEAVEEEVYCYDGMRCLGESERVELIAVESKNGQEVADGEALERDDA